MESDRFEENRCNIFLDLYIIEVQNPKFWKYFIEFMTLYFRLLTCNSLRIYINKLKSDGKGEDYLTYTPGTICPNINISHTSCMDKKMYTIL